MNNLTALEGLTVFSGVFFRKEKYKGRDSCGERV
jgi:hypothetical protein